MQYWQVLWHHDFPDEPVSMHSEMAEDGYETRKVEEFPDGRRAWADTHESTGGTALGEIPVGPIEDVQQQAEFSAWLITKEQFEQAWAEARRG